MNGSASPLGASSKYFPTIQVHDQAAAELLRRSGIGTFDDIWQLPGAFVEPVNRRRGGWSAVSRFSPVIDGIRQDFYIKRQTNQQRYSLRHPFGTLTYRFEVAAIQRNSVLHLPSVPLCCSGFRAWNGEKQGFLVTRAVSGVPLAALANGDTDWRAWLEPLAQAGRQLLTMHQLHIAHGALYPHHLFLDTAGNTVQLIDFERSRCMPSVARAVARDLGPLLKRTHWIPDLAIYALLQPYTRHFPELTRRLVQDHRTGTTIRKSNP